MRKYTRLMSKLLTNKNRHSEIKASSLGLDDHKAIKLVKELKNHPEVTSLDLSCNHLTDQIFGPLSQINLHELKLGGNNITGNHPDFFKNSSNLEILGLDDTLVDNSCVERLAENTSISLLDLSYTEVTNICPLKKHPTITVVDVRYTKVDDRGMEELNEHPTLQVLNIGTTRVTDQGLKNFCFSHSSIINNMIIAGNFFEDAKSTEITVEEFTKSNLSFFAKVIYDELNKLQGICPLSIIILSYLMQIEEDINLNSIVNSTQLNSPSPRNTTFTFFNSLPQNLEKTTPLVRRATL